MCDVWAGEGLVSCWRTPEQDEVSVASRSDEMTLAKVREKKHFPVQALYKKSII